MAEEKKGFWLRSLVNSMERSMTSMFVFFLLCNVGVFFAGCSPSSVPNKILGHFAADTTSGVIAGDMVTLDNGIVFEGKGSFRVNVTEPTVVKLFEVEGLDVEDAALVYRAMLRTEGVVGNAYLEMWCHFPGKGEFFSRGLKDPLSGTSDWTSKEIPFFLRKGERPDFVRLNIVVDGKGTVWIDDIYLETTKHR